MSLAILTSLFSYQVNLSNLMQCLHQIIRNALSPYKQKVPRTVSVLPTGGGVGGGGLGGGFNYPPNISPASQAVKLK